MKNRFVLFLSIVFIITLVTTVNARTWTEAKTGRTLEGQLVKVEGDDALIKLTNLRIVRVKINTLSEADQSYLSNQNSQNEAPKDTGPIINDTAKWETDFAKASERAKAENKHMLLDFTGSDWCGWCIKLKDEVFDQRAFKNYAKKNLVLVEIDFPKNKKLSKSETTQNKKLQKQYGIRGYPTIIILNPDGEQIGRTSYKEGGAKEYIKHIKEIISDA